MSRKSLRQEASGERQRSVDLHKIPLLSCGDSKQVKAKVKDEEPSQ